KMVLPNNESPDFLSAIGLWDIRRDLDARINHEDPRYTSALAIMAAKSAYENESYIKETVEKHWKMEFLGFFNFWNDYEEDYTTQGFMWSDKTGDTELIGVSFRGTSPFNARDWSSDVDLSWYHLQGIGKVHAGFLKALGLQKSKGWPLPNELQTDDQKPYAYYAIRQKLIERLANNPDAKFLVTGHSLGAALAVMFPAILAYHKESDLLTKLEGVYTFGQPRVGDHQFGEYMKDVLESHGMRYHRFVYCNDLVPRVPFDSSDVYFKHFGHCHYYNSFYKGQVLTEEPNKNYFSILALIPMFGNAIWELVRSFILRFQNGPEYCETFTCQGWRVIGLLIAGLPAHGPQDYVNLTRLGSPEIFMIASVDQATNGVNVELINGSNKTD
ncbi:triacylglycerol lipase OBL1, partial [Tanacetum coccineum]